jgi:excisionase family DNA binding protein
MIDEKAGPSRLLSVKDAQAVLGGISRTTVYELINSGDLQRVKIGTRALITSESVAAYMVRQRHGSAQRYDEPLFECCTCSCPIHCRK